jgi:N-acetylmuramic acid 6-phosphate etherase
VKRVLPQVAEIIDVIADALRDGGRLIYVGTGSSGRIAALDAAECPPTFNTPRHTVQFIMAGGLEALSSPAEANEDSPALGRREIARLNPAVSDVVIGLAASGRTPFTVAAIEFARKRGATTVAVSCNRNSALEKAADYAIVVEVGPEVVAGSTRMKAGTAQKMILNMLSTGAMIRLGYVYGNLMVNLHQKNSKLAERAIAIVQRAAGLTRAAASETLRASGHSVPIALIMHEAGTTRSAALRALTAARGNVRSAIELARAGPRAK